MDVQRPRFGSAVSRYIITLVVTMCAYALYATLVVPQIEGSRISRGTAPAPVMPRDDQVIRQKLDGLFPNGSWELQPCIILETQQGKILFQDYDRRDDGSVELKPLSMVIYTDSQSRGEGNEQKTATPPIVLRAPQGALLKFERPLSLTGDMGQLISGQLKGEVQLFRQATTPHRDDSIALVTQNVQVSPERIFTLYEAVFRFGPNQGRGRHLVIDLANPDLQSTAFQPSFAGIERIELAQLDQLHLHREGPQESPSSDDLLGDRHRSLNLSCQGPFVFDAAQLVATFSKKVAAVAADGSGDQLVCDQLAVYFARHDTDAVPVDAEPSLSDRLPPIQINKIVAAGTPVVLTARSRNAQVTAERLEYDIQQRRVFLQSNGRVLLTRDGQRIESPQIHYTFTEDGRLGTALLQGPGRLEQLPTAEQDAVTCRWQQQLSLQPDGDKKVMSLDGAQVQINDVALAARQLHLWVWEIPAGTTADTEPNSKWSFAPAKLFAEGQVQIQSARLDGKCGEAAAFWPRPEPSLNRAAQRHQNLRLHLPGGFRTSLQQLQESDAVWQASATGGEQPTGGMEQPVESPHHRPPSKIHFVGNQVQMKMRGGSDFGAVEELTVVGDVAVEQRNTRQSGPSQLELRGHKLRAISETEDLYRVFVSGSGDAGPASVRSRGLTLTGPNIQLDQRTNRLWIEGPGDMTLLAEPAADGSPTASLRAGTTQVDWRGGMIFDGQQIYFETDVKSETRQEDRETQQTTVTTTECGALSLVLNQRVDFADSKSTVDQSEFQAESMVMVGQLDPGQQRFQQAQADAHRSALLLVSSTYDSSGKLISSHEIIAPQAEFDVAADSARCTGPGSLTIRQLAGTSTRPRPGATPAQLASQKTTPLPLLDPDREIDYVKIDFGESLLGNLERKQLTFIGNVHAHYDGLDDWNSTPNSRQLNRPGGRSVVLDCQQLVLAQWSPGDGVESNVEMIATGEARAKGNQFEATAERISYNQQNDQIVIEAPRRANAELWFQRPGQSNRGHLIAKKILYWMSDGTFEVQESKQIDYSQNEPIRRKK